MTAATAIKKVMKDTNTTQNRMAEMMGYSSQGTVGNALRNDNFSTNVLLQWFDKLGYEVVVQPKTQGKRKDGAIVLEPSGIPDGRGKKRVKEETEV